MDDNNAYLHAILFPEQQRAPRLTIAWATLLAFLADGKEHTPEECAAVLLGCDLAPRTVHNLLAAGRQLGHLRARSDKTLRPYRDGSGHKVVRAIVAYSLPVEVSEP